MKELLASLLALMIPLGMTVRGQGNQPAPPTAGVDGSWGKVEKTGTLVVGPDNVFSLMGCKDTNTSELIGFDIDLAKEACKRLDVEPRLQPIDWNNKQAELDNGNVDCLWSGFSKTPERAEAMALNVPYMSNNQIILIKTESTYETFEDLSSRMVGIQGDSSAKVALNAAEDKEFKSSLKNVMQIDDYTKTILEIQNGTIDAISVDEVAVHFYLKNQPGSFRILESGGMTISLASEGCVVGTRKSNLALKDKIGEALRTMVKDDTMTTISGKWFDEDVTTVDVK